MRRFALVFSVVLLVGVFGAAAEPALAGTTDWAVNGVALTPGQEVAVKFASVSPIQLTVPGQEIDATCAKWKAKGKLVGGTQGTGELTSVKFSKCTEAGATGRAVRVKIEIPHVPIQTDSDHPVGTPTTIEWPLVGLFRKGIKELEIAGVVDAFGPKEGNLVDFPQPSLEATTLTVGGSPAQLVGEGRFTLPKHAMLSQVEL